MLVDRRLGGDAECGSNDDDGVKRGRFFLVVWSFTDNIGDAIGDVSRVLLSLGGVCINGCRYALVVAIVVVDINVVEITFSLVLLLRATR
jgi:hypothetical protein